MSGLATEPQGTDMEKHVMDYAIDIPLDPHDPLNWSTSRKLTIMGITGLWILLGTANILIISPGLAIVSLDLNSPYAISGYLVSGPNLAYGVASFIWVPLANRYGVRLIFIVCAIAAACMSCWAAKATTFSSLVTARTLATIFFAPPETIAPQIVGDLFYLKDRSKAMTWVALLQVSGFAGASLVGSFIIANSSLGWRWVEWIMAIVSSGIAVLMVFLFPETQFTKHETVMSSKRTWVDEFRFWPVSGGGAPKVHSAKAAFLDTLPYFCHPMMWIIMISYALCLCAYSYILTSQSIAYQTVYPFSISMSGVTFVAPLIGAWLAFLFCGPLADHMYARGYSKEGAKPKPEQRLPILFLSGTLGVAGLILFGVCTEDKCHYIAPLIGSALMSFSFIVTLTIIFAYLLDVYEARMDALMVPFNGIKNVAVFGFNYSVVPWTLSSGYKVPFIVIAMILLFAHGIMVVVYLKGEAIRKWSAQKFASAKTTYHGDAF